MAPAMTKAMASARPSQPVITKERIPSIRYEAGFHVATSLNQPTEIKARGMNS